MPDSDRAAWRNNLELIHCQSQINGSNSVKIPVTASGFADKDLIYFVCKGEQVEWDVARDPHLKSITVDFGGTWPFSGASAPFTVTAGTNSTPLGVQAIPTNVPYQVYEYKVTLNRSDDSSVTIDPHIIPMGK